MADTTSASIELGERSRATRELVAYFALAFAITWGLGVVVIFFRPQFEAVFGPLGPLITSWPYYVGVCAPTISAVLVSLMFGGLNGVKGLFGGLVRPFKIQWAFVALLTMAGGYAVWGVVERSLSGITPSVDFHALLVSAPLLLFTTANIFVDPGPWGEETGWRGFALPRLLTLHSPLTAALILGVIWGIWHTPAFIPHMMANLLFSAHVVTNVKIEALVFIVIVAVILAVSGPNLKGFRFARPKAAET